MDANHSQKCSTTVASRAPLRLDAALETQIKENPQFDPEHSAMPPRLFHRSSNTTPHHMTAQPKPLFSSAWIRSVSDLTASSFMRRSSRSVFSSSPSRPW